MQFGAPHPSPFPLLSHHSSNACRFSLFPQYSFAQGFCSSIAKWFNVCLRLAFTKNSDQPVLVLLKLSQLLCKQTVRPNWALFKHTDACIYCIYESIFKMRFLFRTTRAHSIRSREASQLIYQFDSIEYSLSAVCKSWFSNVIHWTFYLVKKLQLNQYVPTIKWMTAK